jgi:uncharacterized Zn-finger protein
MAHIKAHTGDKPNQHDLHDKCDKEISVDQNLQKHFRTFTSDKPYKCGTYITFIRFITSMCSNV